MTQRNPSFDWTPTIGDPSIMGWLTVLVYLVCAYKCFQVVRGSERIFDVLAERQRMLWLGIAGAMLLLGINKQFDLQTLFTEIGRYMAVKQGWYEDRKLYQTRFIVLVGAAGLFVMCALLYLFHRVLKPNLLAIIGISGILVFVLIRAASFHKVDQLIGFSIVGLRMNWILEIGGIALILSNAHILVKKKRPLVGIEVL